MGSETHFNELVFRAQNRLPKMALMLLVCNELQTKGYEFPYGARVSGSQLIDPAAQALSHEANQPQASH
jgi:hypothetical protein